VTALAATTLLNPRAEAPAPLRFLRSVRTSTTVWLALMAYVVLVKLIITAFPAAFRNAAQQAFFEWQLLPVWAVAGLLGVWLATRTGFPEPLGAGISRTRWLLVPALLGLAFGVLEVAFDLATGGTRLAAALTHQPSFTIDFPQSVLIYSGGTVIVEVIFRLLPLPLLLWLISTVVLRKRAQGTVFWALALLTSALEPLGLYGDFLAVLPAGLLVGLFVSDYAMNLTQAAVFANYVFLPMLVVPLAGYLVLHILYGNVLPALVS